MAIKGWHTPQGSRQPAARFGIVPAFLVCCAACANEPSITAAEPTPDACNQATWNAPFEPPTAGSGYCFIGAPPQPTDFVAAVDKPASIACACPFAGEVGAASLSIAIDFADVTAANADWAGIHFGPQGSAHVPFGVEVAGFDSHGATKSTFQMRARLCTEGKPIGKRDGAVNLHLDGNTATFRSRTADYLGAAVLIAANPTAAATFCGHWAVLQVVLRDKMTGQWGQCERTIRLYQADTGAFVP